MMVHAFHRGGPIGGHMARVVIVTGAAGGIGSALVRRFQGLGDQVVGLDLVDGLDVRDPEACQAACDRIASEHGRIDVLCNNAGTSAVGDVLHATAEDWDRVLGVNVVGVANMSKAALVHMRAARCGVIVNTCSVAASVGLVERAVYSASKGAVLALTKAMAADEIAHGIRVCCVSPATVATPWVDRLVAAAPDPELAREALRRRQPMGRLVEADEVSAAIAYLAADTTCTTGADLLLDAGITGVRLVD
jgi:NAD(P)-dependent dehydrogenase (short-subunit alcohol dehydrogenase family)